ncbi:hypothetical protein M426DRAFT_7914 [Hypoxylon sp. CI-4A]|nr:hypothetical protein M426DRAFT_7914 [Hypoxylon sp. CI-4A]
MNAAAALLCLVDVGFFDLIERNAHWYGFADELLVEPSDEQRLLDSGMIRDTQDDSFIYGDAYARSCESLAWRIPATPINESECEFEFESEPEYSPLVVEHLYSGPMLERPASPLQTVTFDTPPRQTETNESCSTQSIQLDHVEELENLAGIMKRVELGNGRGDLMADIESHDTAIMVLKRAIKLNRERIESLKDRWDESPLDNPHKEETRSDETPPLVEEATIEEEAGSDESPPQTEATTVEKETGSDETPPPADEATAEGKAVGWKGKNVEHRVKDIPGIVITSGEGLFITH